MKVSQNNQRLQKTKYLGSSAKGRVELEDRQRVHREFSATSKGERSEVEYGSLERILSRENLLLAISLNLKNRRVPDRYALWCERTENKIIIFLLLDFLRREFVFIKGRKGE